MEFKFAFIIRIIHHLCDQEFALFWAEMNHRDLLIRKFTQAGMVVDACHPSTWEVEARESGVHGSPQQRSELEASSA